LLSSPSSRVQTFLGVGTMASYQPYSSSR
jgi:hypothetical protein